MSPELQNKKLMQSVMRAYAKGDAAPLLAALDDQVVWISNSPRAFFRFGGEHRGRAEVKAFIAMVYTRYHFLRMEPRLIVTQGDIVWGEFDAEAKHIPTGRIVRSDLTFRWVVRNHRIVAHHGFFDTAGVLLQQGEIPVAA